MTQCIHIPYPYGYLRLHEIEGPFARSINRCAVDVNAMIAMWLAIGIFNIEIVC